MSTLLKKARAKTELLLMSIGHQLTDISIKEIPKKWENFLNTKDRWVKVELPESEDRTCCLFEGKKGNVFKRHFHSTSSEQLTILNKGGKVKIFSENEVITLEYPNSYAFDRNEEHGVKWLEDTQVMLVWTPAFKEGWEAKTK